MSNNKMTIDLITQKDLEILKENIINEIKNLFQKPEQCNEWLKSSEVRKVLSCSEGTLFNLRTKGELPFYKINGTIYYKKSEIDQLLHSKIVA